MKTLKQLIRRYPIISSAIVLLMMSLLTEIQIEKLLQSYIGYQAAFYVRVDLEQGLVAAAAALLISKLGLVKRAGFTAPKNIKSIWLVWPIIVLSLLGGASFLDGSMKIDFSKPLTVFLFLLAPLSTGFIEELVCRGFTLTVMLDKFGRNKKGVYTAVIVSNLLFGLLHFTNFITGRGTLIQISSQSVYAFFFGVFFSALFLRFESLWPSILTHAFFDFMNTLQEISVGSNFNNTMSGNDNLLSILIVISISALLFAYGLFLIRPKKLAKISAEKT